ncbi:MAG: DUF2252 family protein [Hyphomicrobiales bacterium]|nr:DUF2252 family protein [Hyphomicrobiales bacterium]MBV8825844.1 DUF2252 family protein [Hyphomicrobiales bacterium]
MADSGRKLPSPSARAKPLAARRKLKMARSLGTYIRGSTTSFYQWLVHPAAAIPAGPPVWICGDCHIGNFGPIASSDGEIKIQIRDFDQATIGNPAFDLIRLGLSLAADAATSDLSGVTTARMLEHLQQSYAAGLTQPGRSPAKADDPKLLRKLLRVAENRSWKKLCKERFDGAQRSIPLGSRFWPISQRERDEIGRLVASDEMSSLVTCLRGRDNKTKLTLLDAAYWVKGCSSLGRLRYAVLLAVQDKSGKPDYCLIDIKEAVRPKAPAHRRAGFPKHDGQRVVLAARRLSPSVGQRMQPGRILGRAVFIRELRPQDIQPEIPRLAKDEVLKLAAFLAGVLARAHADQMNASTRREWKRKLTGRRRSKGRSASWLWENVVELMARHERAYLEHCRDVPL